jgi:hypothetical protein
MVILLCKGRNHHSVNSYEIFKISYIIHTFITIKTWC